MAAKGIPLPPLIQQIILDPSGLHAGAAKAKQAMAPVNKAMNTATASTMGMGQSLNTLGFRAMTTGRMLMKFLVAPLAIIGVTSVKSFATFEAHMSKIQALVGVTAGSVERMAERVKQASIETGRSPQELANAMFFVASAGLRGSVALEVLSASAKGAAVGLGETKVVADAATSAINAYGAENLPAAEAVDVLTAAVREGKVEANRLAPAIGKAIPVAAAMGIEFHEVAAAIAAMTRTGTDARTSAIQLRQIMQSILDPSRQTTRALKEMGIAEGELIRQARDEGLLAVLKRLRDLAKENADAFADVFPNIRALAGALDITGPNLAENEQIFKALANSVGDTDKAFQITSKTIANKMARAFGELKVAYLELGEALLPLADILIVVIKEVASVFEMIGNTPWIGAAIIGIVTLGTVMAGFLILLGNVATSIAFKAQMTAYMSAQTVVATKVTVAHTAATRGQAAALALSAKAAAASAASMRMLMFAMSGPVLIGLVVGVSLLAAAMHLFGKRTKSSTEQMQDLIDAVKDVRMIGGRAITTLGGLGAMVTGGIGGSNAFVFREVANFKESFDAEIQDAFEKDPKHAQNVIEQSLLKAFVGAGDSREVRLVIDELVRGYGDQLGKAMEGDLFARHIEGGFEGPDFAKLLTLSDPEGMTVALEASAKNAVEMAQESLKEYSKMIADGIEDGIINLESPRFGQVESIEKYITDSGVEEVLASLSDDLDDFLRKGQIEDFVVTYSELVSSLSENVKDPVALKFLVDNLPRLSELIPDQFAENLVSGEPLDMSSTLLQIHSISEQIEGIRGRPEREWSDPEKELVEDWTGALGDVPDSILDIAEHYAESVDVVRRENFEVRRSFDVLGDGTGEVAARMTDAEINTAAFELVVSKLGSTMDDGIVYTVTYADALADLATVYATADATAKNFENRFDDLIGRNIAVESATMSWYDSLEDVTEALYESAGAINVNAAAGRKSRGSIHNAIEDSRALASAWIESGDDIDDVADRYLMMIQALGERMDLAGMDPDEINRLFSGMGLNLSNLNLTFLSTDAEKAEVQAGFEAALELILAGVVDPATGLALGGELYTSVLKGFGQTAKRQKNQFVAVFDDHMRAILRDLGIRIPEGIKTTFYGIGETIISEQARLLLDESAGLTHVIQRAVEESMSAADGAIRVGVRRMNASMDFSEAERKLDRMRETTHGGLGIDTVYEQLQEDQLKRRVADAERELMLGKGHQEDLKLALLEAEFALEDFGVAADEGSDVFKAEIALAEAGQEVANAEAAMRIEGDLAVTTFNNLARAVGLTADEMGRLTGLTAEGDASLFGGLISERDRLWINEIAGGRDMSSTRPDERTDAEKVADYVDRGMELGGGTGSVTTRGIGTQPGEMGSGDMEGSGVPYTMPGWNQMYGNNLPVDFVPSADPTGSRTPGTRRDVTNLTFNMNTTIDSSGDVASDINGSMQGMAEAGMVFGQSGGYAGQNTSAPDETVDDSWRGNDPRYG